MKQLLLLATLFIGISAFAQDGTSLDEYRYLSKGYVYQLEMGLDAQKEGYFVKNIFQSTNGADLIGLFSYGNPEPRALLVILQSENEKATYVCIPNSTADKRVKDLANVEQSKISTTLKTKYQSALNEFLFAALANPDIKTYAYQPKKKGVGDTRMDETLVSRSADLDKYIPTKAVPIKTKESNPTKTIAVKGTVSGEIANRSILKAEDPVVDVQKKGVIAVKICVDDQGNVSTAKYTQRGSTTFDAYLKKAAVAAAKKLKFNASKSMEQCGIVTYKF